ncbi:hypothetical protein H2248_011150 [Termitomyces sp. 'cryptogamus']|nr:hypothetical protein H2248_011150 [Termitomyces sp. 'cryptogamus']
MPQSLRTVKKSFVDVTINGGVNTPIPKETHPNCTQLLMNRLEKIVVYNSHAKGGYDEGF